MLGRPTKYKAEYCEKLIESMATGLSYEAFAGALGVAKQTLYDWEKEHAAFAEAKSIGVEKSRLFWELLGRDHVISETTTGIGGKSLNASVWIFNMKNRFLWRDRQADEADNININTLALLTDEQLDQKLLEKEEKLKLK